MLQNISITYPFWYILLCLLLGFIYAGYLYRKDRSLESVSSTSKWIMAMLRFLGVTAIALLLLSPMLKSYTEDIKKPIILIAEDDSESIFADQDSSAINSFQKGMSEMAEKLSEKYEVKRVSFGDKVYDDGADSTHRKVTNISTVMDFVSDNYADQNLGAIVLATDGIYNEGKNPLYTPTHSTAPIYSIAMGDTTVRKDLLVVNVFHNKIAYLNDQFVIQVDIRADNAVGQRSTMKVQEVTEGGNKTISSESIRINDNDFFLSKDFTLTANRAGVIRYRISLSPIDQEVTRANNVKDIYVEVLDARRKILILADGPHPDIAAMKELITENKNYEVTSAFAADSPDVKAYDLVILHNLPSKKNKITSALLDLKNKRTPRLFVVGATTSVRDFNAVQSVIKASGNGSLLEDIQADVVDGFTDFTQSDDLKNILKTFPPLLAPFGEYHAEGGSKVLLNQNIKKVKTDAPMMAFNTSDGYPTAVLVGEGIWKWKLFNFLKKEDFTIVQELMNKSLQLIAKKEDKRKFRVNQSKNIYKENENILFDAQLYNTSYEMINTPDVTMKVFDSEGKQYDYSFTRTTDYYTLSAGQLQPGNYSYRASVTYNGEELKDQGRFSVQNIQLESYDLTARHGLLRNLSKGSGGSLYYPDDIAALSDHLFNSETIKPVAYQSSKTQSLLHNKWLFFLIIGFLIAEWFMRRYSGL